MDRQLIQRAVCVLFLSLGCVIGNVSAQAKKQQVQQSEKQSADNVAQRKLERALAARINAKRIRAEQENQRKLSVEQANLLRLKKMQAKEEELAKRLAKVAKEKASIESLGDKKDLDHQNQARLKQVTKSELELQQQMAALAQAKALVERQIRQLKKGVQEKSAKTKQSQDEKRKLAAERARKRREEQRKKDRVAVRQYLTKRNIDPSREGIRSYLLQMTDQTRDWSKAKQLIEKLSSPIYNERALAQEKLLQLPEVPIKLLRETVKSSDREQAFRARMILKNAIPLRRQTVEKVFLAIHLFEYDGLTEESLKTLRLFHDQASVVRAARQAFVSVCNKRDIPALVKAFNDSELESLKRVAVYTMRTLEEPTLANSFHIWTNDTSLADEYRLQAALGLADLGDRRSLGALVELMSVAGKPAIQSRSNVALRKLTEQNFKFSAYGKKEKQLGKIEQWKKWIAEKGAMANLRYPLHSIRIGKSYLNGNTLLAFGYNNKVVEYDDEMNEVFNYPCQGPWSAEKMSNGNYLIAEYRKNRVIEVSPDKKVVREYKVNGPLNARPLENGNVLVASYSQRKVIEYSPEGESVWSFTGRSMVADAVRMDNGNTLVSEYQGVSIVNQKGERVWELTNKDVKGLNQVMGVQALDNGNVLLTSMAGFVAEFDRETKKQVWRHNCSRPSDAFRLPNGNTLITEANRFVEVDPDGKEVWAKTGSNYGTARK